MYVLSALFDRLESRGSPEFANQVRSAMLCEDEITVSIDSSFNARRQKSPPWK